MATNEFSGLTEDTYRFFWDIAFQNNTQFFEKSRERYRESVQKPMLQLAAALGPYAAEIDPRFQTRPSSVVSRIRRDTRYSKDKSPFRDHMWLGYKLPGSFTSECFTVYVEFSREEYGYGVGMYTPNPALMQEFRGRMLAKSSTFLSLVEDPAFSSLFETEGESYRKPRFTDEKPELQPWLNRRQLSFCFSSQELKKTLEPGILDEIVHAFAVMKPVYRFLMGLE